MKVFVVLVSLTVVALASLEPAGYRPPGSSSQYLPPHHDHHQHKDHYHEHDHYQREQHQHEHHQHEHHQHEQHQHESSGYPSSRVPSSSSQYLPPNYSYSTPAPADPSIHNQYLPPSRQQQDLTPPANNYLPAEEKSFLPPSTEYLPPLPNNSYLPPTSKAQIGNEYLPPHQAPSTNYLPPTVAAERANPSQEYLPPSTPSSKGAGTLPKSDYLPPRQTARARKPVAGPATVVPSVSVKTAAPYKPDGPAYAPKPKYGAPGLEASTRASPLSGYPAAGGRDHEATNYLPPDVDAKDGYGAAQGGYQYGGARSGVNGEEQSGEPAKYDFEYRVSDEYGNDFGHKESREGTQTQGIYSVLLPDGRKQIVHYEADEEGFKPRISYEEVATVLGWKGAGDATAASGGYEKSSNSLENQGPY